MRKETVSYSEAFKMQIIEELIPGLVAGSAFLVGGTVFNIVRSALYNKPHERKDRNNKE